METGVTCEKQLAYVVGQSEFCQLITIFANCVNSDFLFVSKFASSPNLDHRRCIFFLLLL